MSDVTVKQLAEVVGTEVDKLLDQLKSAGIEASGADDAISNSDKRKLLDFLRESHGKASRSGSGPRRVTLKRKSTTELKQTSSGARGQTKTVNVEFRTKRTYVKRSAVGGADDPERLAAQKALEEARAEREAEVQAQEQERKAQEAEQKAKEKAEQEAAAKAAAEAKAEEEAAAQAEAAAEQRKREEVEEAAREAQERRAAEREEVARREREDLVADRVRRAAAKRAQEKGKGAGATTRYGRKELHVTQAAGRKRKGKGGKPVFEVKQEGGFSKPAAPVKRTVQVPETITVGELAEAMAVKAGEVIKEMMKMGSMVTINQTIDQDTAILVAEELGHEAVPAQARDIEQELLAETQASDEHAVARPPVVTVMGHVDHGKTSLLDRIRAADVVEGEAGGITQHIGAYHVDTGKGTVTFLDTPGHAAFTAMRARGAQATDIVILVVAANDGVKPQTKEAIEHARAAQVPIVVAVNKVDLSDADVDRTKQELSKVEVIPEDWGGQEQFIEVSAKTGTGIDALLEAIVLLGEVNEYKANPDGQMRGTVVESQLDKGRGPVATILVQDGTLNKGDMLLAGEYYGRVRAMFDEHGKTIDAAGPSIPVQVVGLSGTPMAGEDSLVVANERKAREAAAIRQNRSRDKRLAAQQAAKLENLFDNVGSGDTQQVNLLIRADVQGSSEALKDTLTDLSNDEVKVNVISAGVGSITESDATLAVASNAIIIGFNVRADATARRTIKENELDLRYYSVIYDAIDDVKKAIVGLLGTETREEIIGLAEVKDVFRSSAFGAIAGSLVTEGVVKRDNPIRVLRDNVVIYEGELESLRRFRDDVPEVRAGTECGIGVKEYNDVKPGDQIECFERYEVERTL